MMQTSKARHSTRRVALAFPVRFGHFSMVATGIADYARLKGPWVFSTSAESFDFPIQSLKTWRGDGIIAVLSNEAEARAARQWDVPVVTFVGALRDPGVARVSVDNPGIGRIAAHHLLARGFSSFGFYGVRDLAYAEDRRQGFAERLQQAGYVPAMHLAANPSVPDYSWEDEIDTLGEWLLALPRPAGIFAINDQRARLVTEAARHVGLSVPKDVGVIGVDNDKLFCELGDPPVSSVVCDWRRIGFEAAELLDNLMQGGTQPAASRVIPPVGVATRQSTDILFVRDPDVTKAVDFVQKNLSQVFGVEALIKATDMSRRHLEKAFHNALGCTPYRFICQTRVARAKELLQDESVKTLTRIAAECGFLDVRNFRQVFQRIEGVGPAEYRNLILASRMPTKP